MSFLLLSSWQSLKKLGKEKSPGWDGITTEFWLEVWDELANSCMAMLNSAFTEGRLGASIKKGLIKFTKINELIARRHKEDYK